jgi:PAS domain S-box-containing protein
MYWTRSNLVLLICIISAIGITLVKFLSPGMVFFNSGLLLVIMLTIFLKKDLFTYVFSIFVVIIIMSSLILSTNPITRVVVFQQVLASVIAIVTMFVVLLVKRLYRSIEGERKQLNALFENSTEGIILTNRKGEIVLVNPEARRLFMYDNEEMLGKQIEMLVPQQSRMSHLQYREEYVQSPSNRNMAHGRELFAVKKNGHEFPVEVSLSYYTQANEFFALAFIVDISQRRESENKLVQQKAQLEKVTFDIRRMNTELENKVAERTLILQEALQELERSQSELNDALNKEKELNEIKSRFVSMASHEFRTPLSTILSSASLVSKYDQTDEQDKRDKHIRRIKDSVKHLNDLLEDFLNLGKLEEGRVSTQVILFDVREFLHDVFDEMKSIIKKGQQLKLCFEGDVDFITDKRLLKNILINLLSNAIKFSGENQVVQIHAINLGHRLIIQVKDQGIGIAREDMQHLFSTFYRGKNAINIQGTGLGLHIVKRYVDLLEGQITISSQLNEGTTFNVGIPDLKSHV